MIRRFALSLLLALACTLPYPLSAADPAAQPSYFELKPSLVANLPSGAKYIRCDIQLMTMDPERMADIQLHAPAIRHELLMLISDSDGEKLKTPQGKEDLRQKALDGVRKLMVKLTGKGSVDELFFTAFFVQ